jgi:hypothetical protein
VGFDIHVICTALEITLVASVKSVLPILDFRISAAVSVQIHHSFNFLPLSEDMGWLSHEAYESHQSLNESPVTMAAAASLYVVLKRRRTPMHETPQRYWLRGGI